MSEFSIICSDFKEGKEIPKKFGYKFENKQPTLDFKNIPEGTQSIGLIMDDPDAMAAVGKVWVHWLQYFDFTLQNLIIEVKQILMKLDMVDQHHLMGVIHTSSRAMH